eukprot:6331463-Heterocapsa_arctica.AAC.1
MLPLQWGSSGENLRVEHAARLRYDGVGRLLVRRDTLPGRRVHARDRWFADWHAKQASSSLSLFRYFTKDVGAGASPRGRY